jgi:hypothetical protein
MGKKASYNDAVPNVKIILQHNRGLEEGEQRYRNVAKIFLENQDGERFLAPTTRPGIARVYARHIAEGGVPNDERWNHIKSICEEYNQMAGFVRATRNKEFNESAQDLINEGANHYSNLRETLHKLTGHRGYHAYFESWTPSLMEDEGDDLSINELFVQETVDPRIESVMPILSKLRKNVAEMTEIDTLAEWADSIISEKLEMDSTTKSMAVPADEMLDEAPGAETLAHNQSTEKKNLKAFGLAEETGEEQPIGKGKQAFIVTYTDGKKVTVLADHDWQAKETAKNHWKLPNAAGIIVKQKEVPGAGTTSTSAPAGKDSAINKATDKAQPTQSDNKAEPTSTWDRVKDAVKKNWNVPGGDGYGGTAKALAGMFEDDVTEMDKSPEANPYSGQGHRKGDDNASRGPDKTAKMMAAKQAVKMARKALDKAFKGDVEENFISMAPQAVAEEEVEESALQAYLGKKKYGEKGMKALQQAGRDGASKEKMASIRAKHDKLEEVDMGQADRTLRHTPRGDDNGKMSHITSLSKAAKKMGHDSYADVPDNAVEKLKTLAKKIRGGDDVSEDLDANQKRVGQLGPTEKVKNNNIGKLVGANESTEIDPELARIIEMARFKR